MSGIRRLVYVIPCCLVLLMKSPSLAAPMNAGRQCQNVPSCRDHLAQGLELLKQNQFKTALDSLEIAMSFCGYRRELPLPSPCTDPRVSYAYAIAKERVMDCRAALPFYKSAQEWSGNAPKDMQESLRAAIAKRLTDPACAATPERIGSKHDRTKGRPPPASRAHSSAQVVNALPPGQVTIAAASAIQTINLKCDFSNAKIESKDGVMNLCGTVGAATVKRHNKLVAGLVVGSITLGTALAVGLGVGLSKGDNPPPPSPPSGALTLVWK